MAAAGHQWVTFDDSHDDDEALSLSDLPVVAEPEEEKEECRGSPMKDDFEFRILGGGGLSSELDMCAAEDVFFHGKLLPLRASFSYECRLLSRGPTRPVSRSDSATSLGLDSWRSVSSSTSTSSSCVSRSLSSNSCASSSDAQPPPPSRSISNVFYAFPSPSPRVRPARKSRSSAGRRSTGSAPPVGWGLLRLGVAKAPEIELHDIRLRRAGGASLKPASGGSVNNSEKRSVNVVSRFLGGGFGCSCSPEDSISSADNVLIVKKKGSKGRSKVAGLSERRERMFEWLEELSLGKG